MFNRTKAATKAPSGPIAQIQHHGSRRRPNPINRTFPPSKPLTWDEIKAIKGPVAVASTDPKHQPQKRTGRSFSAGMTVLHRTRLKPLPAGHPARQMPRPDVLRRQLIRGLRAQGVEVIDEAKAAA
jgi:hypothetical protein